MYCAERGCDGVAAVSGSELSELSDSSGSDGWANLEGSAGSSSAEGEVTDIDDCVSVCADSSGDVTGGSSDS